MNIKSILLSALTEYKKTNQNFLCHEVEELQRKGLINENELSETLRFIKHSIDRNYTLTGFLRYSDVQYSEILGPNNAWCSDEALAYRVKWIENLIKTL